MPWLNHPGYVRLRDELFERIRRQELAFRRTPIVVFLCGQHRSARRDQLKTYIEKRHSDYLIFYAEDVWDEIGSTGARDDNALEVEGRLAGLADAVFVVVESPGTFAELGAFAVSGDLRRKLLPICDRKFASDESFLNAGPLKWIGQQSNFSPPVQADFTVILLSATEIEERLSRIPVPKTRSVAKVDIGTGKELVFLTADLVALLAPVTERHLKYYLDQIVGERRSLSMRSLLGLGVAMGLLAKVSPPGLRFPFYYYSRAGLANPYTYSLRGKRGPADLSTQRMRILAFLQQHRDARDVLNQIWTLA